MNIMAFGTGIRVELGYFNAGWSGMWLEAAPRTAWRSQLQVARPAWVYVPTVTTNWEER